MSGLPPFRNEPTLELRRGPVRDRLAGALAGLDAALPLRVPVLVAGERHFADDFVSTDPGAPERVVASAADGAGDVERAVEAVAAGGGGWGGLGARERAAVLIDAAAILRRRRLELAALEVRECAKPWAEADADVCEAIDFLEFYAREAIRLEDGSAELLQAPGERNSMAYAPRGPTGVIAPWNFPLAIAAGMTAGALAMGNAVVLKPAEQSPATALALVEALLEAGLPPAAIAFVPGDGRAGEALVRNPRIATIAFTGSSAVGRRIIEDAARVAPGQLQVKRVIAEMGGKNCVIVDADADLDEAVPAIVASAFDYAGQKCSAAARVLAHESVASRLIERLAGAVELLSVGQASDLGTDVPPLIEREAAERVAGYVERASRDGRIVATAPSPAGPGWFVAPALATDLDPASPVLAEEVFGPLLTIEPVASVADACEVVRELPFALTGGLFSRNPATVAEAARLLPVGNLYVNRPTTGAMVGRQPFGGNRLSGVGAKAGGPDYLLQFADARVLSENTTRHGIVAG